MSEAAIARELTALKRQYDQLSTIEHRRYAARVYNDAAISVTTSGVPQALTFNSEEYDYNGLHSTSTNTSRLTAAIGGIYTITGHATYTSNATGIRQLTIRKNGASTTWASSVSGGLAAYSPVDASSSANALVNILNSGTYDAASEGGFGTPDWAAGTGWTFDRADSERLTTGITPAAFDGTWTMIVKYTGCNLDHPSAIISAGSTATGRYLDIWPSDKATWPTLRTLYGVGDSTNNTTDATGRTAGVAGLAGRAGWYNNTKDVTLSAPGVTTATGEPIRIAVAVGAGDYFSGNIQRAWIANRAISDAEYLTMYYAMTDLAYPAIAHQNMTAINGDVTRISVATTQYLAAGDYVELLAYQTSGGALNITVEDGCSPYFTMALV